MFPLGGTVLDTAIDDTIAIEYIKIDPVWYVKDNTCYPNENYRHVVLSAIQQSVSDNIVQCAVFYSTKLGHCRDVARMLKSRYESADYYEFNIYVDGKLVYYSGNFLNLDDQNKSFRYFIET